MKIAYQGIAGSYSESCAKEKYPDCETIPCKTFDECFEKASQDNAVRSIIPESNKTTGNIGVEYLIFKYRLNIYSEYFQKIEHNLLGLSGTKISDIKDVYSHAQALSQSSIFIKKNSFNENVRADTAGSAKYISDTKDKTKAAIASELSAKIYNLEIIIGEVKIGEEIILENINIGKVISKVNKNIICMLKIELINKKSENKEEIKINNSTTLKFL